jgi:Kef-type K+ transport system membrane component KefB
VLVGVAAMFSSTIIGIKLLPTTVLHHRHTGEVIISVLLLQDLLAIVVMLGLQALANNAVSLADLARPLVTLPLLIGAAWLTSQYVLLWLFRRYDRVQEYIFLLTLAWCLGVAQAAHAVGLSWEIGAFIGGVVLASSPIALFIAERLKPLRDFFLVLFFFALGANLDLGKLGAVWLPATVLALVMLALKPLVFRFALGRVAETPQLAWETGFRLGQMSEFSLLIAMLATSVPGMNPQVIVLVQLATLLTFTLSSSLVVFYFPTPVALNERLRRD